MKKSVLDPVQTDSFENAPLSSYKKRIVFFGSTLAGL